MTLNDKVDEYIRDVVQADYTLPAHAYYIDSNPAECSTYWYMVNKGRGYVLEDVHFVVTENLRDAIVARNAERYGADAIRYIGQTYEASPFSIGYKTYTEHDRDICDAAHRRLLTREMFAETCARQAYYTRRAGYVADGIMMNLDEWRAQYQGFLNNMNDKQLKQHVNDLVASSRSISHNVTREQAQRQLDEFYLMDYVDEAELVRRDIEKDKWIVHLYRHIMPT